MKVAFELVDRDTAWMFLDPTNAPTEIQIIDFRLDGVAFEDAQDDDKCIWLQSMDNSIRVVPRGSYNFDNPMDKEWPIPSCVIVLDKDDAHYREMNPIEEEDPERCPRCGGGPGDPSCGKSIHNKWV